MPQKKERIESEKQSQSKYYQGQSVAEKENANFKSHQKTYCVLMGRWPQSAHTKKLTSLSLKVFFPYTIECSQIVLHLIFILFFFVFLYFVSECKTFYLQLDMYIKRKKCQEWKCFDFPCAFSREKAL